MEMIHNAPRHSTSSIAVPWRSCDFCKGETFKSPRDFINHLRIRHCRKEGGSYICTYGPNSLCLNLPLEGVCDKDYEIHVSRFHASPSIDNHVDAKTLKKSDSGAGLLIESGSATSQMADRRSSSHLVTPYEQDKG